jgi:hypothetical protein
MAVASGLKRSRAMVWARDGRINTVAAGWSAGDAAVAVTQDALDHFATSPLRHFATSPLRHAAREALQSLVVHGFGPIVAGDTRLNIRPIGMVFGLEMRCRMGQTLSQPNEPNQRLGGVLYLRGQRSDALASQVQHMLLIPEHENKVTGWLDSHPMLAQRVRRIDSRAMGALPLVGGAGAGLLVEPPTEIGVHHPGPGWTLV